MSDGDRPQDAGRRHRRRGQPSAATASLLTDYHEAMRTELRAILTELEGVMEPAGLGMVEPVRRRPDMKTRAALWDLGIKLGRELGAEVDVPAPAGPAGEPAAPRPRRGRVDFG